MAQTSNRILDEFARLMTDAAGVARGVRDEAEAVFRSQAEKVLRDLDVVQREEFEAVREMAVRAREENERLSARLAELETQLGGAAGGQSTASSGRAGPSPGKPARRPRKGSTGEDAPPA